MDEVAFGRYRLIELIGEGGMGKVYKAHDTVMRRDVAIKVLPPELATEPGYRERFQREAYTAARLTEPHIIPVYEAGEIDGRLYLVMPIVDGVDLHSLLQRDGPMSPKRGVKVIEQLAAALDAAHTAGLVHRDVKPSNALLVGRDFVYLIDFGIAHDATATRLTGTGMLVGTLAYMAPERFTDGVADVRSDVYALACVLHECLTGEQPYPGHSMEQQIAGHLNLDPPRPSARRPDLPLAFDGVIGRGMAKDPDRRYHTALDLAAAAEQALTEPVSVPAVETPRVGAPIVRADGIGHYPTQRPHSDPAWSQPPPQAPLRPPVGGAGRPPAPSPLAPLQQPPHSAPARHSRAPWIIAGVAAVVVVVGVVGGISAIVGDQSPSVAPTSEAEPTPQTLPTSQTTQTTTTVSIETGNTIVYGSMNTTATLDCGSGKSLNVSGSGNTLTVTGTCETVAIAGRGNRITFDKINSKLSVLGSDNTIIPTKTVTRG